MYPDRPNVKVRTKGQKYAHNLCLFLHKEDWDVPGQFSENSGHHQQSTLGQYSVPFHSECHASGRLHETCNHCLVISYYGYILLDKKHERKLFGKHGLKSNGLTDYVCNNGLRGCLLGRRTGRQLSIHGILFKGPGSPYDFENPAKGVATAHRMLRDDVQLQKLDIFEFDAHPGQLIDIKHCNINTSLTKPRFVTLPEINPRLEKENPISKRKVQIFSKSRSLKTDEEKPYSLRNYLNEFNKSET